MNVNFKMKVLHTGKILQNFAGFPELFFTSILIIKSTFFPRNQLDAIIFISRE